MKSSKHSSPSVNAGSMADIAFLLLIFFLVTTTISADKGINRKLSEVCHPNEVCTTAISDRNILRISLNGKNDIFVEDEVVSISDIKSIAKAFIDNNGDQSCSYCNGDRDVTSSDNPSTAVISLSNDKETTYEMYVAVQDILTQAYYELRKDYAVNILSKNALQLTDSDLKALKTAYPFKLSEAETKK